MKDVTTLAKAHYSIAAQTDRPALLTAYRYVALAIEADAARKEWARAAHDRMCMCDENGGWGTKAQIQAIGRKVERLARRHEYAFARAENARLAMVAAHEAEFAAKAGGQ
jgi:hypothetical protein